MKQFLTIGFAIVLFLGLSLQGYSQERYIDEVFADVTVTSDVAYGANWSMFPAFLDPRLDTMIVPLVMDVYQPAGDTATNRPVLAYGIGGTFLPPLINTGFTGLRTDSANVEFATRMAKKGYVVAVVQYRRGWNPLGSALVQQRTILQAAYRGIQDMRNVVRYFRATEADSSNKWGIDPNRIAVGGNGTGGYMAYGATYLKRFEQTLLPKFIDFSDTANPTPFLDTLLFGDPYGIDSAGINNPNYPTFSSDFNVGFALGGALGDSSWVEAGDAPFISLHCERDPGAPFGVGDVIAIDRSTNPPSFFAVIPGGAGGSAVLGKATRLGNQAVFDGVNWTDDISPIAATKNNGALGLYPFDTPFTPGDGMCTGVGLPRDTIQEWGGPWNWFNEAWAQAAWDTAFKAQINSNPPTQVPGSAAVCLNKLGNPNDPAISRLYIDTIVAFLTPRLAVALDLGTSVGKDKFIVDENVEVYPNPVKSFMRIQYRNGIKMLENVRLLDISGRTVRNFTNINAPDFEFQRAGITPGLYILQVSLADGIVNKKILLE